MHSLYHQRFLAGLYNCQNRLNLSIFLSATYISLEKSFSAAASKPLAPAASLLANLGAVQRKLTIVRCEHTAPAGFLDQRNMSYVGSVVTPLIRASVFSVMLPTCSMVITHFASLRDCSAVCEVRRVWEQVPGNTRCPKVPTWACINLFHLLHYVVSL